MFCFKVETGEPGRINGAADSLSVEIPVTITATTKNFTGSYTLKRINDVSGSTPE